MEVWRPSVGIERLRALTGANVASHSAFSSCVVSAPVVPWHKAVTDRLEQLLKLSKGWDGYDGVAVRFENATFAIKVLELVFPGHGPIPQIVPGATGDLQIEWHMDQADIEIHVLGPYRVQAWRATAATGRDGEEVRLTNDFAIVARWINEMLEPRRAAHTTAA
jgi:hypothetical protein